MKDTVVYIKIDSNEMKKIENIRNKDFEIRYNKKVKAFYQEVKLIMKITFLGATKTVTGSNFLVEAAGKRIFLTATRPGI